ncbi:hypothetical protein DPEC_G00350760 [Dallia pectoralis]|uniref:Uncharacterized protein n=1 Tax=Dallia pectoralis TaxID=75939 RepID=A0ACC2F1P9_DALPE|nr:hypothetical protein DPEC_G00350760 [Dallia pectoralis]
MLLDYISTSSNPTHLQIKGASQTTASTPKLTTDMIIRLGRLTPGYFRLLQRQVAGEVQTQPHDRAVNQIAMMLAILGLGLSYYSARQMTEKVRRLQTGPAR